MKKTLFRRTVISVALFLAAAISACGGGGGDGGEVTAAVSLASITVTPANQSITIGTTRQFTATGTYSDGSAKDLTSSVVWTSSHTAVAAINSAGLANSTGTGSTTITAASGSLSGSTTLAINALSLSLVKQVTVTTDAEGGSARPEIVSTANRVFVVYLGNIINGAFTRSFKVRIFDSNLDSVIASKTIVPSTNDYGGPTDIRIAAEGQYVYAFYETASVSTTYLWAAKYALTDTFDLVASTATPITSSLPEFELHDGDEVLNDPAPLVGPTSVFVITRLRYPLASSGKTVYRVREFSKNNLTKLSQFDLDLSDIANGRGRVTSLLYWNNTIYMALATTVSDQGVIETNDDGALCDIILVKMGRDWKFDPQTDVRTISAEPNDRENYITGLRTDGTYFYLTYKQAVGIPPTGEQRAVVRIFDNSFTPLLTRTVQSSPWGPGGGEIRPSIETSGSRIFSGESSGEGIGTGNAKVYVYERN